MTQDQADAEQDNPVDRARADECIEEFNARMAAHPDLPQYDEFKRESHAASEVAILWCAGALIVLFFIFGVSRILS